MRQLRWLVLLAGCGFERGRGASDAGDGNGNGLRDAPMDTRAVTMDGMIDGPPMMPCNANGFVCPGSTLVTMCNGACWARCISIAAIPNQPAASLACLNWGGKLAPLRTAADHQCAVSTLFPGDAHWIGLEQIFTAQSANSGWTWNSDGVAITFEAWGSGQPNDNGGNENGAENCAFINSAGVWHDTACSDGGLFRFSCRR